MAKVLFSPAAEKDVKHLEAGVQTELKDKHIRDNFYKKFSRRIR